MEPETKRKPGRRPGTKFPGVGGRPGGIPNPNGGRKPKPRVTVDINASDFGILRSCAAQEGQTLETYCAAILSQHVSQKLIV